MITFVGVTFNLKEQFGPQEHEIISSITKQIDRKWSDESNLIINLTWFGPQFKNNTAWNDLQKLIKDKKKFTNIFWLCAVDPVCLLPDEMTEIESLLGSENTYYLGVGFAGKYSFNTHAIVVSDEFPNYSEQQLMLTDIDHVFINYNRKPKPHRIQLAQRLCKFNGIVTLGKNDSDYNVSEGIDSDLHLTVEECLDHYTYNGKFALHTNFGGVPYDLCSLGRIDLWQKHFLNIVSETVFYPWDTTFVTEKTWKPIVGMRPFIINGQTQIYQWLRNRGFRTFNQYWNQIPIESATELDIHDLIVDIVKYIDSKTSEELHDIYRAMLPDLIHNRHRFFEYAREQKIKINNLFG
jgi:hypothetical protein